MADFDPSRAVLADRVDEFVAERAQPSDTGVARRVIGDTAVSVAKGVIGAGEAVVGLADLASGGRAGKALEDATGWDPKRTKAALDAYSSPEQRAANAEVGAAKGFVDTAIAALGSPSVIAQAAAESAPLMLGGGAIARGARALAPGVAPVVAGAAGEGIITAGAQAEAVRQETPERVLSGEQALLAGVSGAATGALTLGAGRVAQKLGISDIDIALAGGGMQGQNKGLIRRMAEGALSEGVLEEMPQSAQEQAIQNVALGKPWDEGVGSAAAMGALTGGVIGAGVNVAHGPIAQAAVDGGVKTADEQRPPAPSKSQEDEQADAEIAHWERVGTTGPISAAAASAKIAEIHARGHSVANGEHREATELHAAGEPVAGGGGAAATRTDLAAAVGAAGAGEPRVNLRDVGGDSIEGRWAAQGETGGGADTATSAGIAGPDDHGPATPAGVGGSNDAVQAPGSVQPRDHAVAQLGDQLRALNERISAAANQAATSLENDTPQPTAAQAAAGVYKKGHVRLHGMQISIENPAGSIRVAKDGSWASRMPSHYGYIRRSEGADGDQIDAFLGDQPHSQHVFVIDQMNPTTGKFDEVKVMLGFPSIEAARDTYRAAYPRDWNGLGAITPTSVEQFKSWLRSGDTKRAFASSQMAQLPGGEAKRDKSGNTEGAVSERVRDVESSAQALQQSRRQELQELRRPGDHHVSGVGDELRDFPGRHGAAPGPEVGARPDRQQQGVRTEQLPLGVSAGLGGQPPMLATDGAQRQDADAVRGGARAQRAPHDDVEPGGGARLAHGPGGLTGAPASVDSAVDHIQGRDTDLGPMGRALGAEERDPRAPASPDGPERGHGANVLGEGALGHVQRSHDDVDRVGQGARDHGGRASPSPEDHVAGQGDGARLHVAGTPPRRMQDINGRAGRASDEARVVDSANRAIEDAARRAGAESSRHRRNVDSLADHARAANPDQDPRVRAITSAASAQVTGILDGQRIDAGVGRSLAPGERTLVAAAVQNLLSDVGFPAVFLEDLTPVHVQDGKHDGDGTYRYEARAVGIHQRVLREVAGGDPYAARALRGIIAHEVMHHIDNGPRVYYSAEAPDFAFTVNDEGKRVPTGAIVKQAWQAYLTGPIELQEFLKYPLAKINNPGTAAIDFDSWTNILKNELFAQIGRLYYTNPELLQRAIPLGHALFQEIHDGATAATSIGGARGAVQHALRRRRSSNRPADGIDGGDRRDPREGAGGRQAGARVGGDAGVRHRAAPALARDLDVREPGDDTVSPRNPTGKKSTENALDDPLQIGLAALKADPEAFEHNMALAAKYPNFARGQVRSADKRAERMIEHMVDNLTWLHDHVSPEIRERCQLWYDGANRIATEWAGEYGAQRRTIAGVLAVLSPQKDWYQNVSLAKRVLDTVTRQQDTRWSGEMDVTAARIFGKPEQAPLIDAIRGKSLAELDDIGMRATWVRVFDEAHNARDYEIVSPEGELGSPARNADGRPSKVAWGSTPTIAKAISIFEDPSIENIHRMLGNEHKVRSFYNNIVDPMSAGGHVTIDTHAVAAALLRPLSGNSREVLHNFGSGVVGEPGPRNSIVQGTSGLYGLYAEAYRRAAAARGMLPRQMQSITWEAVRGLFQPTFKAQQRNVDAVDAIWDNFSKGKTTLHEVRQQILELAGGVTAPDWVSAPRHDEEAGRTAHPRAVPRTGVAGRRAGSDDRGGRAAAAPRVAQARARGVEKPAALDTIEGRDEPLWYSGLTNALDKAPWAKDGTAGAGQLRAWLAARSKDGTVKAEELKWSGLEEYLAAQPGKVSRDDVKAFLDQNGVRVEEVTLGAGVSSATIDGESFAIADDGTVFGRDEDRLVALADRLGVSDDAIADAIADRAAHVAGHRIAYADENGGGTKFGSYQLPGGENYRELLLTLPPKRAPFKPPSSVEAWLADQPWYQTWRSKGGDMNEAMRLFDQAMDRERNNTEPTFRSSHFDQPNILAHVRFNERTDAEGRRVLFLEEIQSDWAQKGRKTGFAGQLSAEAKELADIDRIPDAQLTDAQRERGRELLAVVRSQGQQQARHDAVPNAPFVGKTEAWVALALKRMIRYAADNGFDAVAWTTGEQQAARYDLSKAVSVISVSEKGEERGEPFVDLRIEDLKGNAIPVPNGQAMATSGEYRVKTRDLADVVGKELATKIAEGPAYTDYRGGDLKIGGEGMRSFYDKIVPNVANDLLKKMGGGRVANLPISASGLPRNLDRASARVVHRAGVYQVWARNARTDADQIWGDNYSTREAAQAYIDRGGDVQPGLVLTPELRGAAAKPQVLFTFEDGAPGADDAIRASVVTNVGHRFANRLRDLRGLGVQTLGRRQIVEIYADDIPPLERYNTLVQEMDAEKNEGAADADAIADRWGKLRDERQLAELMHDATLAEIDPDKNHVEGDDYAKYVALRRRFEALTDEAKQTYRDARKTYNRHWFAVREAIQQRIERSMPDNPARAKLLKRMDDEFFGRVKGVYFPLARFGNYVIVAKDAAGDKTAVSFAETLNEAEATRTRMLRQFPGSKGFTVGKILARREFNASRDAVGRGFMQELFAVLDQSGAGRELQDAVNQLYLTSLPDLSWAKHGIHRKGTPGFSQDARRAFAQNVFHGTRYLAKLRYADQLQTELDAMQRHVDRHTNDSAYDSIAAQKVVDEMQKRHQVYMNPNVSPLSTALTSLGFVWHLGLSPASAIVNLTQTPLVAYPLMGAKWGYAKAGAALLAASKQTAANGNDLRKALKGEELRAYDEAVKAGVIDVTLAHDLAGIAAGEGAQVHWKLRPVMKAASWLFSSAERYNRQATFIAAYRLARGAGAAHAKAYAEAVDATYRGHFDYSAGNRPRFMQGNVARVVLLFKQFAQNMIYTLARTGLEATRGDKEAQKAFAGLLVTHALGAGILGLPIVSTLLAAASMVGGSDDEPWDAETALRNFLADALGQKPAEMLVHGLSRGTPWDISGRIGLDRLLFPDINESLEGARFAESWAASALGPVAGIGVNAAKGLHDIAGGHWSRGLEAMLPAALRGPVRALRYANEGEVDRKGIPVLENTTLAEEIGQALGFAPGRVREANDAKFAALSAEDRRKERRTELLTQFSRAWLDRDESGKIAAQETIREYNRVNADAPILGHHLAASIRLRVRRAAESEHGYWVPRGRRAEAEQVGRFGWQE